MTKKGKKDKKDNEEVIELKKNKKKEKKRKDESEEEEEDDDDGSDSFIHEDDSDDDSESDSDSDDSYFSYESESVSGDEYEEEYENRSKKVSLDDLPENVRTAYLNKHQLWVNKAKAEKPEILISDPFKEGSFFNSYITYLVRTKSPNKDINSEDTGVSVRRRYSDFEWLFMALLYRYPGMLVEKLPPKKYYKNTDKEFIDERLHGLQRFMNGLVNNIYVTHDNLFKDFLSLCDNDFYNLRNNNNIQNYYDFGALKEAVISDSKNIAAFKTVVLHVKDNRPNEGLSRWNNYLRHLPSPQQVEAALRKFGVHINTCIIQISKIKNALQGMIDDGTNLCNITKDFRVALNEYIQTNQNLSLDSLKVSEATQLKHIELLKHITELSSSVQTWHELQFFQPQEILPELIYEFELQLDNYVGMKELLLRHDALWAEFTRSWKIRDNHQFEMAKAKANGESGKYRQLKKQFYDMDYHCKVDRFILQQISKAIIYCEYDQFINNRCESFKKTVYEFAHLQIVIAKRQISRWKVLLKNLGTKIDDELLDECEDKVDMGCNFQVESSSQSSRSRSGSVSSYERDNNDDIEGKGNEE